jgi:hypothetical protein
MSNKGRLPASGLGSKRPEQHRVFARLHKPIAIPSFSPSLSPCMNNSNKRDCLRLRPPVRVRPGPSVNAVFLCSIGKSIRQSDQHALQSLLDWFHSDEAEVFYKDETLLLQELCKEVNTNASR